MAHAQGRARARLEVGGEQRCGEAHQAERAERLARVKWLGWLSPTQSVPTVGLDLNGHDVRATIKRPARRGMLRAALDCHPTVEHAHTVEMAEPAGSHREGNGLESDLSPSNSAMTQGFKMKAETLSKI